VVSTPTTPDRPEDLDDPTGVRALLAGLPDPGPMPSHVVDRINASIAAEQEARAGTRVVSLAQRRRPWRRLGLAAAAVAVAAVAVPTLVTGTGPGGVLASLSGSTRQSSPAAGALSQEAGTGAQGLAGGSAGATAGSTAGAAGDGSAADKRMAAPGGAVSIYQTNTAYTAKDFTRQVQVFIDRPGSPLAPLAAEAPSIGPAGTPTGLQPCLDALHLESATRVMADLGTFEGTQAVVLVVSSDTGQSAFAVRRTCTAGHTSPLAGPVHLP
jgi:hypothetical protein